MERHGGTTSRTAQFVRRYEVWVLHMPGQEWQIEKRFYVDRSSGREMRQRRNVYVLPALGGHEVSKDSSSVRVDLALAATGEELVPPPGQPTEREGQPDAP
jgi:hypothetical protein